VRVEVLGLSAGAPLGGACPCYAVEHESTLVLLDCGPGALDRIWSRGLIGAVDAILISHMHLDHMLDLLPYSGELTQIAAREARADYSRPSLFLPRDRGREVLDGLAHALGSSPSRFDDGFEIQEYDDAGPIEVGSLRITFARTAHPEVCYAARVSDGASTFVYGADGAFDERLVAHAAGADLLLLEATYLDPGPELERNGHMTGEQAAAVAHQAGARRLVLTHLGPWSEHNEENLRRARERFAGAVELARPGAVYVT
jgi:ribonuclease BN (tRNA processing enzyme)